MKHKKKKATILIKEVEVSGELEVSQSIEKPILLMSIMMMMMMMMKEEAMEKEKDNQTVL